MPVDKQYDFNGLLARTSVQQDSYRIEVAIPVRDIGAIQDGTAWKLHFARNRRGAAKAGYTIDGESYHVPINYRMAVFGSALLKNIAFDEVDDQVIRAWSSDLNGKQTAFPVKTPSGHAARIVDGRLYQGLSLKKKSQPQPLSLRFRAWGSGALQILVYRYADIPLENPKDGQYTRRGFVQTDRICTFELGPSGQAYSFSYTVKPEEYIALAFHAKDAVIDDLAISPLPQALP